MTRVRHSETAAFSKGLEILYGASDMESLPGRVTSCLRELFECELATFDVIDVSAVRWNTLIVFPVLPDLEALVAVLQRCAHAHPIVSHAARHRYPHAIRISDLRGLRQYRESEIYRELFVPYVSGVDRQLGFLARPSATLAFGASVNRRGRDFSAEQRTLMEMLRPHLLQAHSLARAHQEIQEREQSIREDLAATIGGGICEIDADGKMERMTTAIQPMLVRYFPAWHGGSKFLPPDLWARLDTALAKGRKGADGSPALGRTWYFPRAFGTLKVQLAARSAVGWWRLLLTEKSGDPSAEVIATRHGLSRREAEVLFWIGQGKSSEEIGVILSVSVRTVEKHTEHLFEKLHVYNRTAAARIAMGG